MGHGKETPRQKMIGMMYLVLTAMLALNVSADILNGFVLVNKGLVKTTENFVAKNASSYDIFNAELEKTPDKVKPFHDKAFQVREMANLLAFELQEAKIKILTYCDGENAESLIPNGWSVGGKTTFEINDALIKAKDNYDKPTEMFTTARPGADPLGTILKLKIEEFKDFILTLTEDESVKRGIQDALNTDGCVDKGGASLNWEHCSFYHMPLVAALTMLSKLQGDVRNAEADIIQHLLSQIGATDTKVNKMEAIVQSLRPSFVLRGGEYEARILLAAYDSLQKPEIVLGPYQRTADGGYEMQGAGRLLDYDARGRAIFKATGSSVGTFTQPGLLRMVTPDGVVSHPFNIEWQVGESQTVISATKMNVLYISVENNISISMSGVPMERISATMTNGTITKSGNEWIAKPTSAGTARITASGTVDGRTISNSQDYRVKMLPTPIAKIGGRAGGNIEKNVLMGQPGVNAELEDFLYDLRYQVTQFNVVAVTTAGERAASSTSAAFTDQQKSLINGLTKGQKLFITGIKARIAGGSGAAVDLRDIIFTIN